MKTWTTWLLAGALAASLQWNLRTSRAVDEVAGTAPEVSCAIDAAALGLGEEQWVELERLWGAECARSTELEDRAQARLAALRARLADPAASREELDGLVEEVAALRRDALAACVESVLAVRSVLTPAQLGALLEACREEGSCAPAGPGAPVTTGSRSACGTTGSCPLERE